MDDATPVEVRIGAELRDRGETIAVAESCTGGLVGSLITDVAGSSDYFVGGVITYTNRSKLGTLAVSRESLERHGPVSKPVAEEMAQHGRDEAGATWGVSTTGYADPTGGSTTEPPGTVYIGVAYAGDGAEGNEGGDPAEGSEDGDSSHTVVERHQFDGSRREVKRRIAEQALSAALTRIRSTE